MSVKDWLFFYAGAGDENKTKQEQETDRKNTTNIVIHPDPQHTNDTEVARAGLQITYVN